jgi:hypothetical protein
MPRIPWTDADLDVRLFTLSGDLPGKTLRHLLFATGLWEFLLYEHEAGNEVLQSAQDLVITEMLESGMVKLQNEEDGTTAPDEAVHPAQGQGNSP